MSEFVVIANYWKGEAAVFLKSLNHSFKRTLPESHTRLGWPFAASFFFFFFKTIYGSVQKYGDGKICF